MPGKGKKPSSDASPEKGRSRKKTAASKSASRRKHPDQRRAEQEEKRSQAEEKTPAGAKDAAKTSADTDRAAEPEPEEDQPEDSADSKAEPQAFPIIGIGASAGGLEALEAFFSALPADSAMAYVVITHTPAEHASMLPDILRRESKVPIHVIEDGMVVEPDTIFIPPSDRDPVMEKNAFRLKKRATKPELHMPVDRFLRHLAAERGERAGCVILSGTGTDGTQGLRMIKEQSGVTVAQSADSAKHAGMPKSAIDTGMVDYELAPEEMPARLIEYFKHPAVIAARPKKGDKKVEDGLRKILNFLANRTRHDFSQYKESTLIRRIQRRATVTRSKDASEYFKVLSRNSDEVWALFQDLLIGVTNFFREPEAFEFLKNEVLPDLISRTPTDAEVRVWAPGCATGEEAYSIAIVFNECMQENNLARRLQIFGTDIDAKAIEKARKGVYPKNIASDVGETRLKRYFNRENENYYIKGEIREQVLFAEQNLLRDPPFSRLDMLVCRNLLIYLKPQAQKTLFPLFHYSLKDEGVLFLGTSETVSHYPELFRPLDKHLSIYAKKEAVARPEIKFPTGKISRVRDADDAGRDDNAEATQHADIEEVIDSMLLREHTPACVTINPAGEILYIHGRTGKYLELAPGKLNARIVDLAREGLRFPLLSALRQVKDQNAPVCKRGVRVKINGEHVFVDLTVKPLRERPLKDCKLVIFEEAPPPVERESSDQPADQDAEQKIAELEQELNRLRHDYRGAMEELESSNEELRSVNEEMQSSNEELQSTNEELESSREELQSLNEELNTVNSELHSKVEQLKDAYAAITNVLNSTRIAVVFLDTELRVQRFTDEAGRLINLIHSDVGRPLDHIKHNLDCEDLTDKAREVLKNLKSFEDEVRTGDGNWYRMNIMVNRIDENVIEGVVITFVNIDAQKQAQEQVRRLKDREVAAAKRFAESIIDTVRESLLVLDDQMRVITANRRFYDTFATDESETEGKSLFQIGAGQWDIAELRKLLQETAEEGKAFEDYRVEHRFAEIGHKKMLLNGRLLRENEIDATKILLAIEDVTDNREGKGAA